MANLVDINALLERNVSYPVETNQQGYIPSLIVSNSLWHCTGTVAGVICGQRQVLLQAVVFNRFNIGLIRL